MNSGLTTIEDYLDLGTLWSSLSPAAQRELLLTDLFALLTLGLSRSDALKPWILSRCQEIESEPDGHLDLWSREHYKSTVITFAQTIQNVLRDPELTVGIFSHTRPIAKGFLRQIKREFESNETLRELFPDILWADPAKQAPKWSEDDGIIVQRKGNPKESTIEAWGLVDGQPTGKHFRLMVYDDVVTQASVTTPDMIRKTTEAVELSFNLGSEGGRRRFIGTRYHGADSYKTLMDRGTAKPRIRLATSDGTLDGDLAIWSRETLQEKRRDMGPYTFAAQIMQNPQFDQTQGFKREWLKHYQNRSGEGMNKYMLIDAANSKRASSDYTAIWIVGLASDRNYYVLDMIRDRLNLTERASAVLKLHRQWRPTEVRYEEYGLMADIQYLQTLQEQQNYRFAVTPVKGRVSKPERIRRLIPICEQGKLYLPQMLNYTDYEGRVVDLVHAFIEEEYTAFPVGAHDDMLDALSRIAEPELDLVWPMLTLERGERYKKSSRPSTAWAA